MTLERWKRITEWPLTALAICFLGAYTYSVVGDLHGAADNMPEAVMNVVWAVFLIDYIVGLALARPRRRWFLTHLHELLLVAVPIFRPLRLLRLLSVVMIIHRGSIGAFRGRVAVFAVTTTGLLVLVAGLAVLDAEQDAHGANIRNIGDALWWAFETITTVGYGDYYPVTIAGRLVAVGLMAAGVALLGTVTALLASWFVDQVKAQPESRASACGSRLPDDGRSGPLAAVRGFRLARGLRLPGGDHAHPEEPPVGR